MPYIYLHKPLFEDQLHENEGDNLKELSDEVRLNLSFKDLKLYHHGIFLSEPNDKLNNFAFHKFKWRRYCSHYDHVHLIQLFQTELDIKCDLIDLRVNNNDIITMHRLDIEYKTDIISLLLSNFIRCKLLIHY